MDMHTKACSTIIAPAPEPRTITSSSFIAFTSPLNINLKEFIFKRLVCSPPGIKNFGRFHTKHNYANVIARSEEDSFALLGTGCAISSL
jgi:hypothetical protein